MSTCDSVAERVALGEPLGPLAEHVVTCETCRRVVELASRLGASHREIDPGLGFSARMTVGAQHRLVARRRRRVAGGLAAVVAAGAAGLVLVTRTPAPAPPAPAIEAATNEPPADDAVVLDDAELAGLVRMSDTRRARRLGADWARIQRPVAAYQYLVNDTAEGTSP